MEESIKIQKHHIEEILERYGVKQEVANILFLNEGYSKEEEFRVRVICKVELVDKSEYIVKVILEEEHPRELIEEQSIFSECLRKFGINTAKRLKCDGGYCSLYSVQGLMMSVTVEEYIGEEVKFINENIVEKIAILMAQMHKISEGNNCHINSNTIWDIFNERTDIMRGYVKFEELRPMIIKLDESNSELYDNIISVYKARKSNIYKLWSKLPRYATQGDYSINNLTYKNSEIGIFDYNIAGDEVLVSDMIIEGLFVSKIMELSEELKDEDRDGLFKLFIKTYMKYRKLSNDEISVMNDIYAITVSFWWDRMIYDENESLVAILKSKNCDKLKSFLQETYLILKSNYFKLWN